MTKKFIFLPLFFFAAYTMFTTNALATSVKVFDLFGGDYSDAEKSPATSEDDLMCWAASAANILAWTGWGYPPGESFKNADDIFQYFQDHWTDAGGSPEYALDWWFDGTNISEGWADYSQVNVPGGGFWTGETFSDYYKNDKNDPTVMNTIADLTQNGYGISLSVYDGSTKHALTAWGYEVDASNNYLGIYVTDSDDVEKLGYIANFLKYYEVTLTDVTLPNGTTVQQWFLQDYYSTSNNYITEVHGLARSPHVSPTPEPSTMFLFGLGILGLSGVSRKKR